MLRVVVLAAVIASASEAQTRHLVPTLSVGSMAQATSDSGYNWSGLVVTGGFELRRLGPFALRAEGMVAGFFSGFGGGVYCGGKCITPSTPSSLLGGSVSVVAMPEGWPLYATIGAGTWESPSSTPDAFIQGFTTSVGIPIRAVRGLSIEARYDRPRSPIDLLVSTLSVNVRIAR